MKSAKYIFLISLVILSSCQKSGNRLQRMSEDKVAKELLQGIWVDDSSDKPVLSVIGDTLRYADQNAAPVLFKIIRDSIYLLGVGPISYKIARDGENSFWINTSIDEVVK